MSQRINILLAKVGDLLAFLPLMWHENQKGNRQAIMTCKTFASVLDGCGYVDVIPFDGHPWEIEKAFVEAKKLSTDVKVVQVAGPPEVVKRLTYEANGQEKATTESFAKEPWKLLNRLEVWKDQPPLIFDKRNEEREVALLALQRLDDRAPILIAASGITSPFPYRALLFELVTRRFLEHQIIDLSTIKAERLYDLIPLYEKAHCLITTDTAHMHLCNAVRALPVVALTQDSPSLWSGSPWKPQHIFHCRYRDFPARAIDLLNSIEMIGMVGTHFRADTKSPKIIHLQNAYQEWCPTKGADEWSEEYGATDRWIWTPIEPGALGRDSRYSPIKDKERNPFVKDAIRLACLRAKDDDLICWTHNDAVLKFGATDDLLKSVPCFSHRTEKDERGQTHHPDVDLFAFTKSWWQSRTSEYPDMVMGSDHHWGRVMKELILKHGGKELPLITWRKP